MVAAWPGTINQNVLLDGYDEKGEDEGVAKQKPNVGPENRRRRSYIQTKMVTFTQYLTFTEWEALETLYDVTLKTGVLPVTRNHPRKGSATQVTMTFEERPASGNPVSYNKFLVTFKMRMYGA